MVLCWLVDRDVYDEDLVTLVYAAPDGERAVTLQWSANMVLRKEVTAGREVDPADLESVDDPGDRERYAAEATRVRENNAPDDRV